MTLTGPKQPQLPDWVPSGLEDFVHCSSDSYEIEKGPVDWVPIPKSDFTPDTPPDLDFTTNDGGGVDITVGWGPITPISITASVVGGKLQVTSPLLPTEALNKWVKDLNDSFEANGKELVDLEIRGGKLHAKKQDIAVDAVVVGGAVVGGVVAADATGAAPPPAGGEADAVDSGGWGWPAKVAVGVGVVLVGIASWFLFRRRRWRGGRCDYHDDSGDHHDHAAHDNNHRDDNDDPGHDDD